MKKKQSKGFGPGFIITAAFVGPGTVITCTATGANYGTALLWTLIFAGITTFILQEMSMRLSIAGNYDLASSIRNLFARPVVGKVLAILIALGILIGCIAYQAGNLIGGSSGIQMIFGGPVELWVAVQCIVAFFLLWSGKYKVIEKALVILVFIMSISFIITACYNLPEIGKLFSGLLVPSIPPGALLTIVALIGTTVVPYNIFLHARIAREKWLLNDTDDKDAVLRWGRLDLLMGVTVGILISLAIVVSAAGGLGDSEITDISSMSEPLKKAFGLFGTTIFGIGLWAAGMTSAITAPLAAVYTISGAFGWEKDSKDFLFRAIWIGVLLTGFLFAITSVDPVVLILTAQAFNAFILPFAAIFLLIALNKKSLVGDAHNRPWQNILAVLVIVIVIFLGLRYLLKAFSIAA